MKTFYYGCDLLNVAAQVWLVFQIISGLYEPKVTGKRFYTGQVVVAGIIMLVKCFDAFRCQYLFSNTVMMIMAFILAIGGIILYECRFWDALCLNIMGFAGIALIDFFIQTCVFLVLDELGWQRDILLSVSVARGLYQLGWIILLIPADRMLRKWLARNRMEVLRHRKQGYALLILLLAFMVYFQRIYLKMASGQLLGLWFVFLLCNALMFMLFWLNLIKHRAETENRMKQMKIELLEENYHMLQKVYQERAILVHDMKNHLRIINGMIEKGHEKDAAAYISEITGVLKHGEEIVWSSHETVDLILNMKFQEARGAKIQVNCKCEDMRGLVLGFVEICALFSNLLDNAIEANERYPVEKGRRMDVFCTRREEELVISISNPVNHEAEDKGKQLLATTKRDKSAHGFGIPSIQNVLDRYGGYMKVEVKNHNFRIVAYLRAFHL